MYSKTNLVNLKSANQQYVMHRQKGFVLFLALVSLVVMSLAAVALIRSVDTNSLITGNLAFRQNATLSSAYGLEAVAQTIGAQPYGYQETNDAGNGYYATCRTFDGNAGNPCGGENLTQDARWVPDTTSQMANNLTGVVNGVDLYGNTVQYIVERMCNQAGATLPGRCMTVTNLTDDGGVNCIEGGQKLCKNKIDYPLYRITVRIAGPKNTISYVQAFFS